MFRLIFLGVLAVLLRNCAGQQDCYITGATEPKNENQSESQKTKTAVDLRSLNFRSNGAKINGDVEDWKLKLIAKSQILEDNIGNIRKIVTCLMEELETLQTEVHSLRHNFFVQTEPQDSTKSVTEQENITVIVPTSRLKPAESNTAEEACRTPNSEQGNCISIHTCPSLLELVTKTGLTQTEVEFLKNSQCGFEGDVPKVCCPAAAPECSTPEGKPGKCVGLYSCPQISNLLKPPVSNDVIQYIQKTKCKGTSQYSVCCGPPRDVQKPPIDKSRGNCAARVTAFPADPVTECCGLDGSFNNRIVGGNATSVDQYPWLVIIEYEKDGKTKLLCGGALISGKYVLTAGHCVAGAVLAVGTPVRVRLGDYDISHEGKDCVPTEGGGTDCTDGELKIDIEQTIPHPDYLTNSARRHDIALIRLKTMAPYNDFIRPICLPSKDITLSPPQDFILYTSGWGAVNEFQASSNIKLYVDLPFVDQSTCQQKYNVSQRKASLWKGQMCAGGHKGKDSCKGDSGGPLMYENAKYYEILGVVSFGPLPCGLDGIPGVYTKVYEYLDWINSIITN